jgi:hypothetical protein
MPIGRLSRTTIGAENTSSASRSELAFQATRSRGRVLSAVAAVPLFKAALVMSAVIAGSSTYPLPSTSDVLFFTLSFLLSCRPEMDVVKILPLWDFTKGSRSLCHNTGQA